LDLFGCRKVYILHMLLFVENASLYILKQIMMGLEAQNKENM
jgi:hypothetical protein